MDSGKKVGELARSLLKERGWTQEMLAERMGISQQSVWSILRGAHSPQRRTLISLATAFCLPVDDFLAQAGIEPQSGKRASELERRIRDLEAQVKALARIHVPEAVRENIE